MTWRSCKSCYRRQERLDYYVQLHPQKILIAFWFFACNSACLYRSSVLDLWPFKIIYWLQFYCNVVSHCVEEIWGFYLHFHLRIHRDGTDLNTQIHPYFWCSRCPPFNSFPVHRAGEIRLQTLDLWVKSQTWVKLLENRLHRAWAH